MATKSLSCRPSAEASGAAAPLCRPSLGLGDGRPRLTLSPVSADALAPLVLRDVHGALVSFDGRVRGTEDGRAIAAIFYEAYEKMAEREIEKIVRETERRWPVAVAVLHRLGRVAVGEAAVAVACAGAHRPEAFAACAYTINEIKERAPIWKARFERA